PEAGTRRLRGRQPVRLGLLRRLQPDDRPCLRHPVPAPRPPAQSRLRHLPPRQRLGLERPELLSPGPNARTWQNRSFIRKIRTGAVFVCPFQRLFCPPSQALGPRSSCPSPLFAPGLNPFAKPDARFGVAVTKISFR